MTGKAQRGVQSVDTGGQILRVLLRGGSPMMLRDLAEAMDAAPAKLHPYLVSFKAMEMVEQTPNGRYQLGPFALQLGLARLRQTDGYRGTLERIGALARDLGHMVSLSVWGVHGPVITYVREAPVPLHVNVRVGGHYAMLGTATGKIFAAWLPSEITEELVSREQATIAVRGDHDAKVAEARRNGFATTVDQPIPGISAIAVPVLDHMGQIQHAVTLIGPTGQIDLDPSGRDVTGLLAFSRKRSADLGYDPAIGLPASV